MRRPWRAWLILIFLTLTLLISGYRIAERQGLLIGMILCLALISYVFILVHERLLSLLDANEVEGRDPWNVLAAAGHLAKEFKIPRPRVFIIPSLTAAGFALGRSWQRGRIILSEGALTRLDESERQMLMGYLMCQIRRRDTLGLCLGQGLASVILVPARIGDRTLTWILRRGLHPVDVFKTLVSPLASLVVRLVVGRQIYFDCDREVAQVLRNPEQLARVLWKLESWARSHPLTVPASAAHLFVVNPLTSKNWNRYFHNQPSVARRIQLLVGRYPI